MKYNRDNVNKADGDGYFPIHDIAIRSIVKDTVLQELIDLGAEIESKTSQGRTALHMACHFGNRHLVEVLIKNGANVNAIDDEGYTPLFMAVSNSNASIPVLIKAGADIDHLNNAGMTPLMHACKVGKVGAVKKLCELGANTGIDKYSSKSILRRVIESSPSVFPTNALQMVRALIKAGAMVSTKDVKTGETELHIIALRTKNKRINSKNYFEVMKVLINAKANPWENDDKGESPLSLIHEKGLEVLKPALKRYIKGKEVTIVTGIKTVTELKAFFFNQSKLSKNEVYELLKEDTPAKNYFSEALALPPITI